MQCLSCGKVSHENSRFCVSCGYVFGTPRKAVTPRSIRYFRQCLSCRTFVPDDNRFCTNCGFVFHDQQIDQTDTTRSMIRWTLEKKRVKVATEIIHVPTGVNIAVKRSRTIEHTVDVNWNVSMASSIDAGLKGIISASIQGEIEQTQGHTYRQSETIEYEVQLKGENSSRYELIWTDIWRTGVVEIRQGKMSGTLPLHYCEHTEIEVIPLGK